ncbi:MAG: energy transducer TonB [Prevotella sp.]|nr:energy transducer TonB [Prevotella sp.]
MKTYTILCALCIAVTTATAQPSEENLRYKIDYVKESHLMKKGNQLTVVHIDFEWPERLSGMPTTALEKTLCQLLFQNTAEGLRPGLQTFLDGMGTELDKMPDEEGLDVRYVQLHLQGLAWEKDKYMSLRTIRKYRRGNQELADSILNDLLTYDIVADKVLQTGTIINKKALFENEINYFFASLIVKYAGDFALLNFDYLPDQTCLMPMGMLFNLPGYCNEDGIEAISLVPYVKLSNFMKKRAKKTLVGKNKPRKDRPQPSLSPSEPPRGEKVDTTKVYLIPDTKAEFTESGGVNKFLNRQVKYPPYEALMGIEGKVVINFVVERNGSITEPSVVSPVSPGIDRESVKAILDMPRWKAATVQGQPVRSRVSLPVYFKLDK